MTEPTNAISPDPLPNALPSPLRKSMRWLLLAAFFMVGCSADQATKIWAQAEFRDQPSLSLVPNLLEFRYAENHAIAFSMLSDIPGHVRTPLIYTLTSVSLLALLTVVWKMRNQGFLNLLPMAMILGGAVGNIQDRLKHGYVIDFVHVHWRDVWSFPIFNLADSLITVGGALMILTLFLGKDDRDEEIAEAKAA